MGNRAVITTFKGDEETYKIEGSKHIGVYLHWNGGRDSINAFITYCDMMNFRYPEDDNYGWARLCQVISNFMGSDGMSVGADVLTKLDYDNGDNGVYVIEKWKIVDRKFFDGFEQNEYDLEEMLNAIDSRQPKPDQLGEIKIKEYLEKKKRP